MNPVANQERSPFKVGTAPRTMPPGIPTRLLEYLRTPWVVVMAAFGYRLFYIFQHHLDDLPTAFNHMLFGYEVGRIASSVASGHGFSSPFPGWSGPTAWLGPVYPLLLAAVFKIFGAYSHSSGRDSDHQLRLCSAHRPHHLPDWQRTLRSD